MPLKEISLGWHKKIVAAVDQKRRLEKALKDLAMLKTICYSGNVVELLPYVKTLFQNANNDGSFQNFKFNHVERAKITIFNNAVIWTDKVIGCVKSYFEDDLHKDTIQSAYKVLNYWTVMVEKPKQNTA